MRAERPVKAVPTDRWSLGTKTIDTGMVEILHALDLGDPGHAASPNPGGVVGAAVGNDYYVHLARVGAVYEPLKKVTPSYYSALIVRGNYDCRHVRRL